MVAGKRDWIAGAIKKPGALRATAKREGLVKGDQKIPKADIKKLEHSKNPTTRRRAELAQTLSKMNKK